MLQGIGLKKYFPLASGMLMGKVRGWIKAVDGVHVHVAEGRHWALWESRGRVKRRWRSFSCSWNDPPRDRCSSMARRYVGLAVMISLAIAARCRRCSRTLTARSTRACALGTSSPSHSRPKAASRAVIRERVAEVLDLVGIRRESAASIRMNSAAANVSVSPLPEHS